jgi:hypothetical protein
MALPDLSGYELESHIHSANRLVVLWFSKTDRQLELWRQIQVTLVNAQLSMANVEIVGSFPTLKYCRISEKPTQGGHRSELLICFDKGMLAFECEAITFTELSRKIRFLPEK